MKLSDLKRFSIEQDLDRATGRISTKLFVLGDEGSNTAQQQLDTISTLTSGSDENDAREKGIQKALDRLEFLQSKELGPIVRLGIDSTEVNPDTNEVAMRVSLGVYESRESGANLIVKRTFGFGNGETVSQAEERAVENALKTLGVE